MTVYRYKAVPLQGAGPAQTGELAAESLPALRASMRRAGLQVVDAKPATARNLAGALRKLPASSLANTLRESVHRRLRSRRTGAKAELFDSLSTMLLAGVPLVEAIGAIASGQSTQTTRALLLETREQLREGLSLDEAMAAHPAWFDPSETAMIRAARASGELPNVLLSLADRHEQAGALSAKLVGALTYPALVFAVGVGVVVFLSTKTLPDLTTILTDAGIEPPALTLAVMAIGQNLTSLGPLLIATTALGVTLAVLVRRTSLGHAVTARLRVLAPLTFRRIALARAWTNLGELARTGVPLVQALRLTAPSVGAAGLRDALLEAADGIERGGTLADVLAEPMWFDDECRRLIAIGESSGELPNILARLADRTHRAASRSIDRLATLMEPAVILLLASMIGVVVMSAVLPILKLQEIIG